MRQLFKDKNFIRICLAAFFMTSCIQLIWVVLPFVIKSLHGSDTDVGLCFMSQMGVYLCFCIYAGVIADRLRPQKILAIGSAVQIAVTCGIFAVVWTQSKFIVSPIMQIVFLMGITGVVTAFYWPVMMGWISKGHEGEELTQRFGFYNVTWGTANMILPIVGGYLMEVNYLSSIGLGIVMMICGLFCLYNISNPAKSQKAHIHQSGETIVEQLSPLNTQFVWISRVALLAVFTCVGMFRSQLGILYKYELGFAESIYGWSVSIMCLFNVAIFYMMGKSHWWHYKKGFYALSQILMLVSLVIIIFSKNLFIQLIATGLAGITHSAIYSSHQYYCVAGGRRRSGRMAIHEMMIGAGYSIGSIFGGMVSDHFGRRSPYIFGCILLASAAVIQIVLWFALEGKNHNSSNEKTSFFTSPT
jgi:MFS family permease